MKRFALPLLPAASYPVLSFPTLRFPPAGRPIPAAAAPAVLRHFPRAADWPVRRCCAAPADSAADKRTVAAPDKPPPVVQTQNASAPALLPAQTDRPYMQPFRLPVAASFPKAAFPEAGSGQYRVPPGIIPAGPIPPSLSYTAWPFQPVLPEVQPVPPIR